MKIKNPHFLNILILLVLSAIAFFPALNNGFVNYDDPTLIFENKIIKTFSLNNTVYIFEQQLNGHYSRFNPLVFTLYSAIHCFNGLDPLNYHLANILFHTGCVIATYVLTFLLTKNLFPALTASILFAVHPVHTEPVAWISALTHPMYSFFYLCAIVCFIQSLGSKFQYFLSMIFFILAGCCFSGGAWTLPFVLAALILYMEGRLSKPGIFKLFPFFILSAFLLALTFHAAKNADIITNPYFNTVQYSFFQRLDLSALSLLKYLQDLILPYTFCIIKPTGLFLKFTNSLLTLALILLLLLMFFPGPKSIKQDPSRFGVLFFLIVMIPFLHLYSTSDSITCDRYAYLSSYGIFLALAVLLQRFAGSFIYNKYSGSLKILLFATGFYLVLLTWSQCGIWKDGATLWTHVIRQFPKAYPAYLGRAEFYWNNGQTHDAMSDIDRALFFKPDYSEALIMKGNILFKNGDYALALNFYSRVLAINPDNPDILNNRANCYFLLKKFPEAEKDYNKSIRLNPDRPLYFLNRAAFYLDQGLYPKAGEDLKKARALDPQNEIAAKKLKEMETLNKISECYDKSCRR